METISFDDFLKVNIVAGTILSAKLNEKAIKPSYILEIDFGPFGKKLSSAQLTEHYMPDDLINQQILAVINFPPKRIAGIMSEVLVLATVSTSDGTILIQPQRPVTNGSRLL
ncbi:MAG: tRNA-binding protein [Gammaproteobacteria bacterium]|jgi:tRNA-binding protein|nr:tRNA-binding protein [Gammaproteobacteria bacterium]